MSILIDYRFLFLMKNQEFIFFISDNTLQTSTAPQTSTAQQTAAALQTAATLHLGKVIENSFFSLRLKALQPVQTSAAPADSGIAAFG